VRVGLFETINIIVIAMAMQVKDLLASFNLLHKLVTYVKDKGGNLSTLAQALTSRLLVVLLWHI
jgi:hypothetical protein